MAAVISINLDIHSPGVTTRRTAVVGETFIIDVMIEDDGTGVSPLVFDTIAFGVYFNDSTPDVLGVTKMHFPHAGELIRRNPGSIDAFSGQRIETNMELSLWPIEEALPEGYQDQAGRAGFRNPEKPFTVYPDDGPISLARGKLNAGFRARNVGTSRIMASAPINRAEMAFEGRPMLAKTIPSVVTVLPEREAGPEQEFKGYPEDPIPPIEPPEVAS